MGWEDTEEPIPSTKKSTKTKPKVKKEAWEETEEPIPTGGAKKEAWEETEESIPGYSDTPLDTLADMAVSVPQGITTWADEVQAGVQAGAKTLVGKKFSEEYDKDLEDIRNRLALARTRSPVASTGAEIGTGIATAFIPGVGVGKLGGAGSMIARGAFEGLGSANDKMSEEGAVNSALGGGIGALGALVSGGLKKISTGNPNEMRANVLGAKTSEFKDIGVKDRETIAKKLKDMGLFSNTKVDFDPKTMKFVPRGKSLESLEKPARDKLFDRVEDAMAKTQAEKMKELGSRVNDVVDLDAIESSIDRAIVKFGGVASDMPIRRQQAEAVKEIVLNDIAEDMQKNGLTDATVGLIEASKQRIGNNVSHYGKNPLIAKTPEEAQIYQMMYAEMNKALRGLMKGTKYADYNEAQQMMLTVKGDLAKALASEGAERAGVGYQGVFNRIGNAVAGSDEAVLGQANVSEFLQKPFVKPVLNAARLGTEEAPFQAIRHISGDIPSTYNFPYAPETEEFKMGTSPNMLPKNSMADPKSILKYRIPRDSESILQNADLVLAKIAQAGVNPEMYDNISYAIRENPDKISDIAPLIATQFPTLFEDSKYGIFDGQIADPNMRAKLADDISKSDTMNSIQKAKIISNLNKNGKIPQGLA